MNIKNLLPGVKKNILLKNHTTFRIGGLAKYFFSAQTKKDLILAVKVAKKNRLPFFVLGGGSNLLVSDAGYGGLVIKNKTENFKIKKEKIISESGVPLGRIIGAAIKKGLGGLEEGSGIPGTVGGAVYGNAGWPKGKWAIGDLVEKVEILWPNGKTEKVGKRWLSFNYRNSRLKKIKINKPIILEVVLKLKKRKIKDLKKKEQEILMIRNGKIPAGFSAGSIFKNPKGFFAGKLGEENKFSSLSFTAAQMIEKCGLKGKRIGSVKISEKHANFIVNLGQGKAKDVKKLIELAKKRVKNKFGIDLEEEICYLGFKN
jgi:UDP-N-acetylmuramate dehydrogenase